MKKLLHISYFLILIITGRTNLLSQTAPPPAAAASSAPSKAYQEPSLKDNLSSAHKFRSLEGRFEIALTHNISGFAALTPKRLGFDASGSSFDWRFKEGVANVMFFDYLSEPPAQTEEGRRNFFAGLRDGTLKALNAQLVQEKPLKINDGSGWQIDFEVSNGIKGMRQMFLIGRRAYSLLIVFDSKIAGTQALAPQVLESFKLISQAEVDSVIRQQIETATPASLPQSPVAPRATSDAEDNNLKGRVKQIIEEEKDLSGTFTAQGRQMSAIEDYNETGNLVKRIGYNGGKVFQITVYGYIGGNRVSNSSLIEDENGPPPIRIVSSASEKPKTKLDLRYEYKYEYRYANNKLSEMRMINNQNRLWLRYVYSYRNNEKTELVFDENNKLNQKYISIIDKNDDEIEQTDYDVASHVYGDRKYSYAYEYDEQGNWIKKTTSQLTEGGSKPTPYYTVYRKITYY